MGFWRKWETLVWSKVQTGLRWSLGEGLVPIFGGWASFQFNASLFLKKKRHSIALIVLCLALGSWKPWIGVLGRGLPFGCPLPN